MGIIAWIVFGFLAGLVARILLPGSGAGGCIMTILLGIAGAVVGGLVGNTLFEMPITGFNWPSFGLAVLGSLMILGAARLLQPRHPMTRTRRW